MPDFHLIFCDPVTKDNEVEIPFNLTGTSVSDTWFAYLYDAIHVQGLTAGNDRWYGWPNKETHQDMCDVINYHLDVCRKYHPNEFDMSCSPNMTQDDFNRLHTYFEKYRGELDNPHPYFTNGTDEYRNSIETVNIYVHKFESIDHSDARANFNFAYSGRRQFTEEENKLFVVDKTKNVLHMEFNMRGKTLMDFIIDEDDHVGEENIRRHKWITADFKLSIDGWTAKQVHRNLERIEDVWHRKGNFLNSLGYYKGDPNNTLGCLPVAHAVDDEIESKIQHRQFLKGARFW